MERVQCVGYTADPAIPKDYAMATPVTVQFRPCRRLRRRVIRHLAAVAAVTRIISDPRPDASSRPDARKRNLFVT
jgi:hypothetical protein